MAYFPMYIDLEYQDCLVVGGGAVALRKIKVLLDFGARVEVVTLDWCEGLMELIRSTDLVNLTEREFCEHDLDDKKLVIAATNDTACNHRISELCQQRNIPVNVVDKKEDCTFILPSYVKEQNVVASFSTAGKSPVVAHYLKEKAYEYLTPLIGEINEVMGGCRKLVQNRYDTERERKLVFQRILAYAIEHDKIPTQQEMEMLICSGFYDD